MSVWCQHQILTSINTTARICFLQSNPIYPWCILQLISIAINDPLVAITERHLLVISWYTQYSMQHTVNTPYRYSTCWCWCQHQAYPVPFEGYRCHCCSTRCGATLGDLCKYYKNLKQLHDALEHLLDSGRFGLKSFEWCQARRTSNCQIIQLLDNDYHCHPLWRNQVTRTAAIRSRGRFFVFKCHRRPFLYRRVHPQVLPQNFRP